MYSTCLNENPPVNSSVPLLTNNPISNDPSALNIDFALFEAALKDMASSNRSLTPSASFASNQLIAAANATRSAQQKQQQQSLRATSNSSNVSTGANLKTNNTSLSSLISSIPSSSYPSLLQEVAHRSSSFVKLLTEAAKQQSYQTCGKDKINSDTISFTDTQFLTPKSVDVPTSRVRVSFHNRIKFLFLFHFNF